MHPEETGKKFHTTSTGEGGAIIFDRRLKHKAGPAEKERLNVSVRHIPPSTPGTKVYIPKPDKSVYKVEKPRGRGHKRK